MANFSPAHCVSTDFTTEQSRKCHRTIQHGNASNRFPCPDCPMTFISNSLLQKHSVAHDQNPVHYTCHCGKSYTSKYCLRRHVAVHSAPMAKCPYRSEGCSFKSRDERLFNVHVRYHRYSDDEYQCQCGHAYKSRECMKHHRDKDGCTRFSWHK